MAATGIVIISNIKQFRKTMQSVEKYVKKIYVHLNIPDMKIEPIPSWGRLISQLYADSNYIISSKIDMRILLGPLKGRCNSTTLALRNIDMIFSDSHLPNICESIQRQFNITQDPIYFTEADATDICEYQHLNTSNKMYNTVVLGGTFDRIHLGHKIFLTQAVLRAREKLVVGVTTANMIKSKILWELILPVEQRISDIRNFLMEVDNSLQYDVVAIDDPFGPTQYEPNLDLIVVSGETLRGGHKVNEIRVKNNLRPLEIFCIDIVESSNNVGPKESKISSSNTRIDLLGTRIRNPEPRAHLSKKPYIIGLTGCIASGKSKMSERFRNMGAITLDCDKIAHEIYEPGNSCFHKIVETFGKDIIDEAGRIDRAKLGPIVFKDKFKLDTLNKIVWPELMVELKKRITDLYEKQKPKVIIIEAAILLQAGWDRECHEVWSMIIPVEESLKRVMERNNLPESEARKRLANQLGNSEIVSKSTVVFSSQWEPGFTQKQAEKAWDMLMQELNAEGVRGNL